MMTAGKTLAFQRLRQVIFQIDMRHVSHYTLP